MHKQPTLNIQTFIIFQLYEELKTEYILKITDFTRDSSWLYCELNTNLFIYFHNKTPKLISH